MIAAVVFLAALFVCCCGGCDAAWEFEPAYYRLEQVLGQNQAGSGEQGGVGFNRAVPFGASVEDPRPHPLYYRLLLFPGGPLLTAEQEKAIWTAAARVRNLREIAAAGRRLSDSEIAPIIGHRELRYLNVAGTRVSEEMLRRIAINTPKLRWLLVSDDRISAEQGSQLSAVRGGLHVYRIARKDIPEVREQLDVPTNVKYEVPPWLAKDLVQHGEYEASDFDGFVRMAQESGGDRGDAPLTPQSVRQFTLWPHAMLCDFSKQHVNDEHLQALRGGLGRVVYLGIARSGVTRAGILTLKELVHLRVLHLDDGLLDQETIGTLATLPHLRWLTIEAAALPSPHEEELRKRLPNVTVRFRLARSETWSGWSCNGWDGPDWARELLGEPQHERYTGFLQAFRFPCAIYVRLPAPNTLKSLPHLPSTTAVRCRDSRIDCDVLNALTAATQMEHLALDAPMAPQPFERFATLPNLDQLGVNCEQLSESDVVSLCRVLAGAPKLRQLGLDQVKLSDEAIRLLGACKHLRVLYVFPRGAQPQPEAFATGVPQLISLQLKSSHYQRDSSGRLVNVNPLLP
jgi:hypothetical protein